jgi:hypothetical protein
MGNGYGSSLRTLTMQWEYQVGKLVHSEPTVVRNESGNSELHLVETRY